MVTRRTRTRGLCGSPGLLPTGLVQLRALARAGPGWLSPVQHSWSSSVGPGTRGLTCNPQKCSFASHYFSSSCCPANRLRLSGIKQQCPFIILIAIILRGPGVVGSVSSPSGCLPGVDGAGWSRLQGFHVHRSGG